MTRVEYVLASFINDFFLSKSVDMVQKKQGQGSQTIVLTGMMAILMIAFLGVKCFCKNEEQVVEEPIEEEVHPRGLFSQVIDKTMSFFGL